MNFKYFKVQRYSILLWIWKCSKKLEYVKCIQSLFVFFLECNSSEIHLQSIYTSFLLCCVKYVSLLWIPSHSFHQSWIIERKDSMGTIYKRLRHCLLSWTRTCRSEMRKNSVSFAFLPKPVIPLCHIFKMI